MESLKVFLLLGLIAQPGLCQFNPALMAMMSGAGGAGRGGLNPMALGMAGGEMGGGMQDLLMMQALSGAGSGGSSAGGGMDPMALMMLGGAGGAAPSSDMMQQYAMMNMLRQSNNQGQGQNQGGQNQGAQGMASNIANLLAGPGAPRVEITPNQQNALWGAVQMSGNGQRIMDAISTPADKIALERDGLQGLNPMMVMPMCPRQTCQFQFCENQEIPYTAQTFYACRGCPRCPMDPNQRNLMNMMNSMGGAASGSSTRMGFPM